MKYITSWSINEEYVYLDDDDADERQVTIHFLDNFGKTKENKIKVLEEMIKTLKSIPK